jgi:probable DNA metabolism protein
MLLIYDDTFAGFLTAVFDAFYLRNDDFSIMALKHLGPTLLNYKICETDDTKSEKVEDAITEKLSSDVMLNVFRAWLSHIPYIEDWIVKYLKLCFKIGRDVSDALQEQSVDHVMRASRTVGREVQRFLGLVRFKSIGDNIYLADIEPDFEILPLCVEHFTGRFSSQRFIIRDLTYKKALIYNTENAIIVDITDGEMASQINDEYEDLWRTYFKSMTIKERINPRLQMQHMPQKYWKHLIEKQ